MDVQTSSWRLKEARYLALTQPCQLLWKNDASSILLSSSARRNPGPNAKGNPVPNARCNHVLEHEQFQRTFSFDKLQANLSEGESYENDTERKNDTLEFERWPHVTRFRKWKTAFPLEVATSSPPPRQATAWLAEIDQAKSLQD